MAEFSKQWCEANDPQLPWDFDIEEEFDKLQNGEFVSLICEGFGFIGIQKQLDGSKFFLYRNADTDELVEIPYQIDEDGTYSYVLGEN